MIRFGGSSGFTINTINVEPKEFDCGTDYKIFVNRIDKVCRKTNTINNFCDIEELQKKLKEATGGDCIQRITVSAREIVGTNIQYEAVTPCADINNLSYNNALIKAPSANCSVPLKAIEITLSTQGYGEGKTIISDPSNFLEQIEEYIPGSLTEFVSSVENWILASYDYNAPMDDFHTFNLSIRGTIPGSSNNGSNNENRLTSACTGSSPVKSTRINLQIDMVSGRVTEEIETTYMGEYTSLSEASNSISVTCQ